MDLKGYYEEGGGGRCWVGGRCRVLVKFTTPQIDTDVILWSLVTKPPKPYPARGANTRLF